MNSTKASWPGLRPCIGFIGIVPRDLEMIITDAEGEKPVGEVLDMPLYYAFFCRDDTAHDLDESLRL